MRAGGNADKTRRAGLTTSQRNKVCSVAAVVVAPENLGKLEVSPGPDSRGLARYKGRRGEGGRRWWQYSKLKSMAALGSSQDGLGAHDQLVEFDL